MLPSRRKKFRFQMPPSDNELWAIGAVAVHWSQLEIFMHAFVHALTVKESQERITFDTMRAADQRIAQWQALVEREIVDPHRTAIRNIIIRVKDAKFMRDRIMHGTWAGTPSGDDVKDSAVFSWGKPRQPFQWDLDFGKIMNVAVTIDGLIIDLFAAVGLVGAAAIQPDKFVTLDDALLHIRRKPNPTP